eukprot:gene4274-6593_t
MGTTITLNNSASMPLVGLGTWKSKPGQVENAVKVALNEGYRHIDCAAVYGNEKEVGSALKDAFASGLRREDVFITSKLWNTKHKSEDVRPACEKTLKDLGLDYLDLYLIHWPTSFKPGDELFPRDDTGNLIFADIPLMETWSAMEKLVDDGLVKAIGVSNFNARQIEEISKVARVPISVNQVESHPYLTQKKLIEFCSSKNIAVTAFSPLGSPDRPWAKLGEPSLLEDPKIKAIASKYGKSPAQLVIRYQAQRGVVVIPKSITPARIKANIDIFDFELSPEDVVDIESFDRGWRACLPTVEIDGKIVPRDGHHPQYPFHDEF